jgi:4-hydroxybenzoate polyprenyltransferase
MTIHHIFIFAFTVGAIYFLYTVVKLLGKQNKTDYEKLELKYNTLLLVILILALLSRFERVGIIDF